jgi:hypothetical protein
VNPNHWLERSLAPDAIQLTADPLNRPTSKMLRSIQELEASMAPALRALA